MDALLVYPTVAWVEAPHLREIHSAMVQRLQDIADGTIQEDSEEYTVPPRGRSRRARAPLQEGNRHTLLGVTIPSQAEGGFVALEAAVKALTEQASSVLASLAHGMATVRQDGQEQADDTGHTHQAHSGADDAVSASREAEHRGGDTANSVSSASQTDDLHDSDDDSSDGGGVEGALGGGALRGLHVVPRANLTLSALDSVSPNLHHSLAADPSIDELNKGIPATMRAARRTRRSRSTGRRA